MQTNLGLFMVLFYQVALAAALTIFLMTTEATDIEKVRVVIASVILSLIFVYVLRQVEKLHIRKETLDVKAPQTKEE